MRYLQKLRNGVIFIAFFASAPLYAQSQPDAAIATRNGESLEVIANNHVVSLPLPIWIAPGDGRADVSENVEISRQSLPGGEFVQMIAPGQSLEDWRYMLSAFVMDKTAFPPEMHKQLVSSAFQQNCAEDKLFVQELDPQVENGLPVAVIACAAFKPELQQGDTPMGEIMAITIVQSETASARIYAEWRGPAFDAEDTGTWPVPNMDEFRATLARLSGLSAINRVD